ncbi:hypothetical protein [Methanoculleus sp.]|jgi:hypothetical protein|nr:hypothetical protein [Methanoculleus sp.]MCK9320156.1 hypothetical protein [Methanoculleus sp.]
MENKNIYEMGLHETIFHEFLAPVEQEVEELTLSEVCKLLGRDIKIKK